MELVCESQYPEYFCNSLALNISFKMDSFLDIRVKEFSNSPRNFLFAYVKLNSSFLCLHSYFFIFKFVVFFCFFPINGKEIVLKIYLLRYCLYRCNQNHYVIDKFQDQVSLCLQVFD